MQKPRPSSSTRSESRRDLRLITTGGEGPGEGLKPPSIAESSLWMILVGIDQYDDPASPELPYCSHDASALAEVFGEGASTGYRETVIRLLTTRSPEPTNKPSRNNIMSAVRHLADAADRNDYVLFGFFGHGIDHEGSSYLLPCDSYSSESMVSETAISLRWIRATLKESRARVKILLFDACHSGGLNTRGSSPSLSQAFSDSLSEIADTEGWVVMSSCAFNEVSWDDEDSGHGLFSYYLLEALSGAADHDGDQRITVLDTYRYTERQTKKKAFERGWTQHPELYWNIQGGTDILWIDRSATAPKSDFSVAAVMGVKGGVGKGTFISSMAQLMADASPSIDVVIIDYDLENQGATRMADARYGAQNRQVKSVFDHIAPHSVGFEGYPQEKEEALWDITPDYLRNHQRGRIWMIPARNLATAGSGFELVANVPPEKRDEVLYSVTNDIVHRIRRLIPQVRWILFDCGASSDNPLYFAAFASADYRYIITLPSPGYSSSIQTIRRMFCERHPGRLDRFGLRTFTVVNRLTAQEEIEACRAFRPSPIVYIPRDPRVEEAGNALGYVDYDLGFSEMFLKVRECMAKSFDEQDVGTIPDDIEVRIKPWWVRLVEEGLAQKTLSSASFRIRSYSLRLVASTSALFFLIQGWQFLRAVLNAKQESDPLPWIYGSGPVLGAALLLGAALYWLFAQERKRRLLKRIAGLGKDVNDSHYKLLTELTEPSNKRYLRWLKELLETELSAERSSRKSVMSTRISASKESKP